MSTAAPPDRTNAAVAGRVLPDERFWNRYSPHHEFSLSSVSSFALHLLILGLAALACMVPFFNRDNSRMELNSIMIGDNGGRPDGDERSRGQDTDPDGQQNLPNDQPRTPPKVADVDLRADARPSFTPLPDAVDTDSRTIQEITDFIEKQRKRPRIAVKDPQTSRGPDNTQPIGDGPNTPGPNKVKNKHIQRMLRWTMAFNTRDGKDYAKQLQSLGAIVAIELPDEPAKVTVYRDLTSPAKGEVEEIKSIKNIWWIDDKPESVSALCGALKIKPEPKRLIAFLPAELEQKLLKLELEYAKGKTEDEIQETVFELKNRGEGRYEPVVIRQR
jgi:hypothetical protein